MDALHYQTTRGTSRPPYHSSHPELDFISHQRQTYAPVPSLTYSLSNSTVIEYLLCVYYVSETVRGDKDIEMERSLFLKALSLTKLQ